MRYDFKLTGVSPILLHSDNVDWADTLDSWRKDTKNRNVTKKGDDRSPAWTWIGSLYHDNEYVSIPAENLTKCLSQAGARIILQGKKTYKEMAVSGLWLESEKHHLMVGGKKVPMEPIRELSKENDFTEHLAVAKSLGFSLFTKRVKIGQAKHIRVRPMFSGWSISGVVEVEAKEITPSILSQLFELSGRVGLGDWRPGCSTPGRYGMFTSEIKPIKE